VIRFIKQKSFVNPPSRGLFVVINPRPVFFISVMGVIRLMLINVKELKEKLTSKHRQGTDTDKGSQSNAHNDLLFKITGSSKN
jgi:hypothetical protein